MSHGECDDFWDSYAAPSWFLHASDDLGLFSNCYTVKQKLSVAEIEFRKFRYFFNKGRKSNWDYDGIGNGPPFEEREKIINYGANE